MSNLHDRAAKALGWSTRDVQSLSMQSLRDLVRPVDPNLAQELSYAIQSGAYVRGTPAPKVPTKSRRTHARRTTAEKPLLLTIADYNAVDDLRAVARSRGVRFGPRKVFLSSIVDTHDPTTRRVLLALHRDGLIKLARADLVAAMDPRLVQASEIQTDGATFHFLVDD